MEKRSDGGVYSGTFSNNELIKGTCKFNDDTGSYDLILGYGDSSIKYADGTTYTGSWSRSGLNEVGKMVFRTAMFMKVNILRRNKRVEMERIPGNPERNMKANGKMIRWMVKENTRKGIKLSYREHLKKVL